ncbi:hypothetical protein GN956_G17861 [Arapaima gigas]
MPAEGVPPGSPNPQASPPVLSGRTAFPASKGDPLGKGELSCGGGAAVAALRARGGVCPPRHIGGDACATNGGEGVKSALSGDSLWVPVPGRVCRPVCSEDQRDGGENTPTHALRTHSASFSIFRDLAGEELVFGRPGPASPLSLSSLCPHPPWFF